jgi:cell wall-associated NlpC family hydrolase
MYYTGLDPRTMEKVYVPTDPHEKAMQRALIQYRNPKNYYLVREALIKAHREDLIGSGPKCLIRAVPPRAGGYPSAVPKKPAPAKPATKAGAKPGAKAPAKSAAKPTGKASAKSPLFFRKGASTGTPVSVSALKNSGNYIGGNTSSKVDKIIATAKKYIGVPYVWGGETPNGFDCSGYVQYVFKVHGINLNRTTETQYKHGTYVSKSNLKPGDLVFFQNTYRAGISHVGIYIGDGKFIHASSSKGVTISNLSSSYYTSHYYGARRVL